MRRKKRSEKFKDSSNLFSHKKKEKKKDGIGALDITLSRRFDTLPPHPAPHSITFSRLP